MELLIASGADVLARNVANTAALNMAVNHANHKNDDRVKRAVAAAGMSQALRREDLAATSDVIELGGGDVNYQDTRPNSGRWTPLILATAKHNHQAVEWLLSIGADPNLAEKDGWTPLFFAVFSGDVELCRPILEAGSDLRHRLPSGKSVLDLARERNAPAVVELLVQHEENERRALEASRTADPVKEVLPNAVETEPSNEELNRERVRRDEQKRRDEQRAREEQQRREEQMKAQRRQEEYIEEDVRYEDVDVAEPEGLLDKVLSFFGM